MIPVMQEIIDPGVGDCFSACLALILDLPLSEVPKFRKENPAPADMMGPVREWVENEFGLSVISLQMEDREGDFMGTDIRIIGALPNTPCIAGGQSPNFEGVNHAVVGTIDGLGNFTLLHDPHPGGKGIVGFPKHIYLFVPMRPEILKTIRKPVSLKFPRAKKREDGFPTRSDQRFYSPAEWAISDAMQAVEVAGASIALTDAVVLLGKAKDRVADHMEGKE